MSEQVFLIAFAMAAGTLVFTVKAIAGAISGRAQRNDLAQLREHVEQQAADLEDARSSLSSQANQLAEIHERLDFAERLLAQSRERGALKPGEKDS